MKLYKNISYTLIAFTALLFSSQSAHAADCSTPNGFAGEQIYNTTYNIMQYCNGTKWIAMGLSSSGGGYWELNGLDLYYNGGNVGVGTNIPSAKLHVIGSIIGTSTLNISGATTLGSSLDVSGNITSTGGLDLDGSITSGGNLDLTGNIIAGGTLGVTGNSTLGGTLSVTGIINAGNAINLANNSVVTACITAGSVRYNATKQSIEVCNGSEWRASSAGGFTPGSVPYANDEGDLTQDNENLNWDKTNFKLTVGKRINFKGETGVLPQTGALSTTKLSDLSDVTLASPDDNEVLTYINGEWVNKSMGSLSGVAVADLSDATITSPAANQSLVFNGTKWINKLLSYTVNDLTDATISSPTNGQALVYNSGVWKNGTLTMALNDLSNVNASTPATDQALVFNGTNWENKTLAFKVSDLSDTSLSALTINDTLVYNGSTWVNKPYDKELNDLTDVTTNGATDGQFLAYNGSDWAPQTVQIDKALDDLTDVSSSSASDGQILIYNGSEWTAQTLVVDKALDDLVDVSTSGATNGQFLAYNGTNWENKDLALGTDTTGDYVAGITASTGITVTGTAAEGWSPTVGISTGGVTTTQILDGTIAAADIASGAVTLTSKVSGVLPIANGGTNNSTAYTSGSVIFSNGTSLTQDNAGLYFDATNNRLGINTTSPNYELQVDGNIYANGGWLRASGQAGVYFESYGGGWYMEDTDWIRAYNGKNIFTPATIYGGADVRAPVFYDSNNMGYYLDPTSTSVISSIYMNGSETINNASPTIYMQDTDHRSAMIHVNANTFHILRGSGTNSTTWSQYNGYWPLTISLENNDATFGGALTAVTSLNSPIYYDSNDSAYYVNPNGTSNLNAVNANGAITFGNSSSVTTCGLGQGNGEGSQRYNYTSHAMEYCNGTTWIALSAFGVGQNYTNLTASRAFNTSYTNNTGKPIAVAVAFLRSANYYSACNFRVSVNSTEIFYGSVAAEDDSSRRGNTYFIVPNGNSYIVNLDCPEGASIQYWNELR